MEKDTVMLENRKSSMQLEEEYWHPKPSNIISLCQCSCHYLLIAKLNIFLQD